MTDLTIVWRCLVCGNQWPDDGKPLPDKCPNCGAPKTEFVLLEED